LISGTICAIIIDAGSPAFTVRQSTKPLCGRTERDNMKNVIRILFLLVIICSAVISVRYAVEMYRDKYAPRYLKGNAC